MKFINSVILTGLLMTTASICVAEEFNQENIVGTWIWTHMTMEGGSDYPINEKVVFGADGSYTQYLPTGDERGKATWSVAGDTLFYNDGKGQQQWKLVSFEDGKLHVDHRGGEMFFERQ